MALIVEDGTGIANAESYVSLEDADVYHSRRGNTAWTTAPESAREAALLQATAYIDAAYTFAGGARTMTQALRWPRTWFVGLPPNLRVATMELALRALAGPLLPDVSARTTTGQLIEQQVGPIREKYAAGSVTTTSGPRYPMIDALLAPLLGGLPGRNAARLVRV